MTQKGNMLEGGEEKKKSIPPNRHGKIAHTRKGKKVAKPSKVTKEMDADRMISSSEESSTHSTCTSQPPASTAELALLRAKLALIRAKLEESRQNEVVMHRHMDEMQAQISTLMKLFHIPNSC